MKINENFLWIFYGEKLRLRKKEDGNLVNSEHDEAFQRAD